MKKLLLLLITILFLGCTALGQNISQSRSFCPATTPDVSTYSLPGYQCNAQEILRQYRIDGGVIVGYDVDCDDQLDFGILYELRYDKNKPYHQYYAPIEEMNPEDTMNLVDIYQQAIRRYREQNPQANGRVYDNCIKMLVPYQTGEV